MSILAGLFVGIITVMIFRVAVLGYYPFPENLEWLKQEDMKTYFDGLQDSAFVMVIVSHMISSFIASLITSLISKKQRFTNGIITGAVMFVFITVVNFMFDFPSLYLMLDTLFTAIAAFAGASFGQGRKV